MSPALHNIHQTGQDTVFSAHQHSLSDPLGTNFCIHRKSKRRVCIICQCCCCCCFFSLFFLPPPSPLTSRSFCPCGAAHLFSPPIPNMCKTYGARESIIPLCMLCSWALMVKFLVHAFSFFVCVHSNWQKKKGSKCRKYIYAFNSTSCSLLESGGLGEK